MNDTLIEHTARFVGVLCIGLVSGIALCVFLAERVWVGGARFYTELMQMLNRALTVPTTGLAAMGMVAMVTDAAMLFKRGAGAPLWLAVIAVLFNVTALALTKFGHFPINDQMLKWDPANPPADWMRIKARWTTLHVGRTFCGVSSFALFTLSNSCGG